MKSTSQDLFTLQICPKVVQLSKIGSFFLQKWILFFYYRDFSPQAGGDAKRAFHLLNAILRTVGKDGYIKESEAIQDTLTIARNSPPLYSSALVIVTTVISISKVRKIFLNYSPLQVATQLTVIDFNMLKNISEDELCSLGWDKKDDTKSPNVNFMVDRWNKVAMWVATEIIASQKNNKRKMIRWFLSVAEKLIDLKNFHTLLAVIAGLNNFFVSRLTEMKTLDAKSRQRMTHLEFYMNTENNWGNYRDRLKKCEGLVVPYLGIFMKDIFIVLDDRPKSHNGYFSFMKLKILQQILSQFYGYKSQHCPSESDSLLIDNLSNLFIKTDKELDDLTPPSLLKTK